MVIVLKKKLKDVKTALIGLDNGGKTSIIHLLEKKLTLGERIKPTVNTEISSQKISLLGLDIFHWDFGGQKQYREHYLKNKAKYFFSVNVTIFVIDIQDVKRYNEALDYMEQILNAIKESNQNCKIFILFHKFDPFLVISEKINENVKELKQKIVKFNPFDTLRFYKTSIYNEISILRPFSDMATYFSDKTQLIEDLLTTYCENTFSKVAILFDKRNFIMDYRKEKDTSVKALEIITHIYSEGIEELEKHSIETLEIVSLVKNSDSKEDDNKAMIFIQKLDLVFNLYLVTLSISSETKHLVHENMKILTEKLIEIFN